MPRGTIRLKNETIADFPAYTVTRGVPLPPGACTSVDDFRFVDAAGTELPSQKRVLQRRGDGSIEWAQCDFVLDLPADESCEVFVETQATAGPEPANPVRLEEDSDSITLDNGVTRITLSKSGGAVIRRWSTAGRTIVDDGDAVDLQTVDMDGRVYRASLSGAYAVNTDETGGGPVRRTAMVSGTHTARDGQTLLDFELRVTLTANCPDVTLMHTFRNHQASEGITEVKAIRLIMPTRINPGADKIMRQAHHGVSFLPRAVAVKENCEMVSASVDDIYDYPAKVKPFNGGTVFVRSKSAMREDYGALPYHMKPGYSMPFREFARVGHMRQTYPFVGWRSDDLTIVASFERWAQLHPKSIHLDESVMTISIWPEWADALRLAQGTSKSHVIHLTAEPGALSVDEAEHKYLRWEIQGVDPVDISFDPAWPIECEVLEVHEMLRYQPDKYPMLENLIEPYRQAGNPDRFTYARHQANGMMSYGDHGGAGGFTNNEDDNRVLVPLVDYLRTGRTYCWDVGSDAARHYMEVDWCEWSTDKRQHGGLIAHTANHYEGCAYPSHQWNEGVLAYYYLTGDERAKRCVIGVGENMIWWVENELGSITLDGREAGMPLVNLAAAHRLTGDDRYMDAARTIINAFHKKWHDQFGELRYNYPQGGHHRNMSGYGDWSSFSGLYRIWEQTGDEDIKQLAISILSQGLKPERFAFNDARTMDFMAVWALIKLTGDDSIVDDLRAACTMLLRRGGAATRRLQFLKVMDDKGLIDESEVGTVGGNI